MERAARMRRRVRGLKGIFLDSERFLFLWGLSDVDWGDERSGTRMGKHSLRRMCRDE